MAMFRTKNEERLNLPKEAREETTKEWVEDHSTGRIDDVSWIARYEYEASLLAPLCKDNSFSKVLELGAGAGKLGDITTFKFLGYNDDFEWTNVDTKEAKILFEKNHFDGKFLVKDLMDSFDVSEDYEKDYDLIVANDFLEHIANPSSVLDNAHKITKDTAKIFISVPNWRMNHTFIYRGLFDYDNWIYTMWIHGWVVEEVHPSILMCDYHPPLSSETHLPEKWIQSWNWYFVGRKRRDDETTFLEGGII